MKKLPNTRMNILISQENPTDPNTVHQLNLLRRIQKENKSAITIFVIISAHVFCWAPFCVVNFTAAVLDFNISESADIACCLMVAVNSCVNPVIYGWLDGSFRAAFKKLLAPILQIRASRTAPTLRNAFHPQQVPYYVQMLYPSHPQRRERTEKFL